MFGRNTVFLQSAPTLLNSAFNSAFPRISRHPLSQNVKQPPPPALLVRDPLLQEGRALILLPLPNLFIGKQRWTCDNCDNSTVWFWDCHPSSTSSGLPSDTTLMTFPGRYSLRASKKFQMFPWLANLLFWFTLLSRCCTGWSGFRPWPKWSSIPRKKFSKSSWEGKRNLDKDPVLGYVGKDPTCLPDLWISVSLLLVKF